MARKARHSPLRVFMNGRLVGLLRREPSGAIDFTYDASWLDWPPAPPVSLSLPLREDRYAGTPVIAVFDNLLPDNDAIRRQIATRVRADRTDAFSLLGAIGRDCVGALQFLPADQPGPKVARSRPAHHHGHLRQCGRGGGKGHRPQNVGLKPAAACKTQADGL